MSRTLPSATVARLNAPETSSAFLTLIEFSHADFPTLRLVNNTKNIVSNGETFSKAPFTAIFPPDTDQINAVGRLSVPNATLEIVDELRSVLGSLDRIQVDMHDIDSADPDTHLRSEAGLELVNVNYNANTMTGDLTRESYVNEPFPGDAMTPANAPGIF